MTQTGLYCILCGTFIHYQSPRASWQAEFRAVRVTNDEEKTRFLTGVGGFIHRDIPFSAPSDPNKRYDDRGYWVTPADEFSPFLSIANRFSIGYVFHDRCWSLLCALTYPTPVSIERFYDICRSIPIRSHSWLHWGHTYGGLLKTYPADYPWEENRIVGMITGSMGTLAKPKMSPYYYHKEDPWDVPEIQHMLSETKESSFQGYDSDETLISPKFRNHTDCFSTLPVELCEEILTQLPMENVVNLRLASRAFASLPLSQYFWSSRFQPDMDRGFVFEARMPDHNPANAGRRDWRALYHKVSESLREGGALANRQRIWNCNRSLAKLLSWSPSDHVRLVKGDQYNNIVWKSVGASYHTPQSVQVSAPSLPYDRLHIQAVRVPLDISRIAVSLVTFNEKQYVSGIRLISRRDSDIEMGYIIPGSEIILDMANEGDSPGSLSGFITAVGPNGIHALRATTLDGRLSRWAGCPDKIPITVRLCTSERISHLKCAFDGFKLAELSVPDSEVGSHERPPQLPLRTTAIWYPDIPPENVYLHESTFAGKDIPQSQYHPLIHLMFGGPQGSYLKYLTRISVMVSGSIIVGIDFEYKCDDAPVERLQAGRHSTVTDDSLKISFTIDGPGEEILTGMQVTGDIASIKASLLLYKIRVTTNRNRSFTFQPNAIPQLKLPPRPQARKKVGKVEITPGTTITGIYIMHPVEAKANQKLFNMGRRGYRALAVQ
ncbi:hypothetical protein AJ79_04639 [Helicocarpus griseus UAMH5409]|uniref:F-box domain-containing protein n=1 Tax=Helicocarpus griseus UAMH5409 TaxID=1447875 RepID=A0A2B7XT66_9EURO|nr:hypothetical protein AJ79_04639 [Helicocarpus griseus UAMH5409]